MRYGLCIVPAAPVRKEDNHRAEMVNQLLFGEPLELLEEKGEWFRVRSLNDGYEGWVTQHLIEEENSEIVLQQQKFTGPDLINPILIKDHILHAPMGSFLTAMDPESGFLWNKEFRYVGNVHYFSEGLNSDDLLQCMTSWLHAPYLWGGKTFMGVDCSGFVQTVFRVQGIQLLRDAWQQAEQGNAIENLKQSAFGDLAFFHNDAGKIIHVGILLNQQQIIHASGSVRIDTIDEQGIIHQTTGKRTHQLHSIRRVMNGV